VDRLLGDNYARERFAILTGALGGEPEPGPHRDALARLCSWTDRPDIVALSDLIKRRVGRATYRCRSLIEELDSIVRASTETNDKGDVVIAISEGLAKRVMFLASSKPGNGDQSS
jgi:hypothetical protein